MIDENIVAPNIQVTRLNPNAPTKNQLSAPITVNIIDIIVNMISPPTILCVYVGILSKKNNKRRTSLRLILHNCFDFVDFAYEYRLCFSILG